MYEEERFCVHCGTHLEWISDYDTAHQLIIGHGEPYPKCKGEMLIDDPDCYGTGRVLGIWHEEAHQKCHGTGKVRHEYPRGHHSPV